MHGLGWGPGSRRAATTALHLSEQTRVQPSTVGAAPDPGTGRLAAGWQGLLAQHCSATVAWASLE